MGQIIGFDSLGTRKTFSAYAPENHDNTIFGSTRKYDKVKGFSRILQDQ